MGGQLEYLNARIGAMKGELLGEKDYRKLLKMENREISEFLEKTSYSEEIDDMGIEYGGKKLVELALIKNQVKTAKKLVNISEGDTRKIIQTYLLKYDIRNLKKLFRWLYSNPETRMSKENIKEYLEDSPRISKKEISSFIDRETDIKEIENFINRNLQEIDFKLEKKDSETEIEILFNKKYLKALKKVLVSTNKLGHHVKTFLSAEIDRANIKTVIRLKDRVDRDKLRDYLILPKNGGKIGRLNRKKLERMVDETWEELISSVKDTYLGNISEDVSTREELETSLDKTRKNIVETLNLSKPVSVGPILGYMLKKEIEVENLRKLVRAKELGITEEQISKRLVF